MLISQIHKIIIEALKPIEFIVKEDKQLIKTKDYLIQLVRLYHKHHLIETYEENYSIKWRVLSKNKQDFIEIFKNYKLGQDDKS